MRDHREELLQQYDLTSKYITDYTRIILVKISVEKQIKISI